MTGTPTRARRSRAPCGAVRNPVVLMLQIG